MKKQLLKKCILLFLLIQLPLIVFAQYSGYVGQVITLPEPTPPAGTSLMWSQYSTSSPYLEVYSGTSSVKIISYFSGYEVVDCYYQVVKEVYQGGHVYYYYYNLSTTYTIRCSSNPPTGLQLSAAPEGGQVAKGTIVKLTVTANGETISDCDIRYTLNGNTPSKSSKKYTSSGITIDKNYTLKAKAYKTGYSDSGVLTENYTIIDKIEISATNFPDANFRNYLLAQSYGKDGFLTSEEINNIKEINVRYKEIASLKGIEYFTSLKNLDCANNNLKSLDLSKNTSLYDLFCIENQITEIDLSNNLNLAILFCSSNKLTSIDVSKNTKLFSIHCDDNTISSIDISNNSYLHDLRCDNNNISSIKFPQNSELTELDCDNNKITTLDIANIKDLKVLRCINNKISTLDVKKMMSLETLVCSGNLLKSLDVSKNEALTALCFDNNQINSIDLSNNCALKRIVLNNNKLSSLDLSKNKSLTDLVCYRNQLTYLALNSNDLRTLDCSINRLTSLDVSANKNLVNLYCSSNQLTSLTVSSEGKLNILSCSKNKLKGDAIDILLNSMPQRSNGSEGTFYFYNNTNNTEENYCTKQQVNSFKVKGWIPKKYNGSEWVDYDVEDESIPVTNIILNKTSLTLKIGQEETLDVTVLPENATNKTVTWSSSNTSIAVVSTTGVVKAIGEGKATIKCTANDGSNIEATCEVTVEASDNYKSIGMGILRDNYFFGNETQVEILQNQEKNNYFKILKPYDGISNVNKGIDYNGSDELELIIVGPGWKIYDISITQNDIVYFRAINTGYYYDKYEAYIEVYHPAAFKRLRSEEHWTHNRVLNYQINGLPEKIQLAPYYYMKEIGGWDETQKDDIIVITFPRDPSGIKLVESPDLIDGNFYDLNGRKVNNPTKGLYIRNGKKYVVK